MRKKLDVDKTIRYLLRIVQDHIGNNERDAHLPATEKTWGFMTDDHVRLLNSSNGHPTTKTELEDPNISINDLPPGNYILADMKDAPQTGWWFYNVIDGGDGRKIIFAFYSYVGRMYVKHVHNSGTSFPNNWTVIPRENLLWSGDENAEGKVLTMNDNLYSYDTLKIYYTNASGARKIASCSLGNIAIADVNVNSDKGGAVIQEMVLSRTNTTLKIEFNGAVDLSGKSVNTLITLKNIVGVRTVANV